MNSRFAVDVQFAEDLAVPAGIGDQVDQIAAAAQAALRQQGVQGSAALSILLTDDQELQRLNREYRGFDEPTDILTFADGTELPELGLYLGDIAISLPTAGRQATAARHELLDELRLLVVHGVLHLLGYDHAEDDEKAKMWAAQDTILTILNLGSPP